MSEVHPKSHKSVKRLPAYFQNNGWQLLDELATAVWAIKATEKARQAAGFMV
ncbi:hypothetical protein E4U57_003825 [Claviceps arundinis]|uniref:Uncharacterized protein n=1 Tax=Claviceps arundinis TaxID=1623583 RepID=A0A9P7SMA1_9HYPO|nr:hypothetical protein E4U57_003825 [Claviceps arundinis]KAG5964216.1 hypothetical protein E4U56_002359 [Claviceps arundinis]